MKLETEVRLLRLLHGELPENETDELHDRLGRDPELAAAYTRLEQVWKGLDLPHASVPQGWSARVMEQVRSQPRSLTGRPATQRTPAPLDSGMRLTWATAPLWVRTAAAAALLVGVAVGAGLGLRVLPEETGSAISLTESYRAMVGDSTAPGQATASPAAPEGAR